MSTALMWDRLAIAQIWTNVVKNIVLRVSSTILIHKMCVPKAGMHI